MFQWDKMGLILQVRTQDLSLSISLHSFFFSLFLFLHFITMARILILEAKHKNKQ